MNLTVVAALLLVPELASDGPLRLVSVGTGDEPVHWLVDGHTVATTWDGHPGHIDVGAGTTALWATTGFTGDWQVLAREDRAVEGVAYVPAWTAHHEAERPPAAAPGWLVPVGLAVLGALMLVPRSKNP